MGSFFMILALILSLAAFVSLFAPQLFNRFFKKSTPSRLKIFLRLLIASFLSVGIAAPFLSNENVVAELPNQPNNSAVASQNYSILSDDNKRTIKRSVEVLLGQRIPSEDLKRLSEEIKNQDHANYDRTFISWRIEGEEDNRWALTSFNPDLSVQLFGLSFDEFTNLTNFKPVVDGQVLGTWIDPSAGVSSHKVVGYKKNGKVYFDEFYVNGARKVHEYDEQEHDGQTRYKAKGDEVFYLVINKDGRLESWTDTKKFNSLKPA